MKKLIKRLSMSVVAATLAFSNSAHAEDDDRVEVTSFYFVNPRDFDLRLAEICGKVKIPVTPDMRLLIRADPGDHEGTYTVIPDINTSKWCAIVYTFRGRAFVTISAGVPAPDQKRGITVQATSRN